MARKSTKADMIAKMLTEGFTAPQIKKRMKVSESYVYAIKKQMEGAMETVKETILSMDTDLSFVKPGEFIQADTNVDAILDERGSRYGNFMDHATITYRLKEVARDFAAQHGKHFAYDQCEAFDMIFHKLGRILNGDPNYADSWIDIAGYAKLVADRLEGKVR
jgi:hypothetical protein